MTALHANPDMDRPHSADPELTATALLHALMQYGDVIETPRGRMLMLPADGGVIDAINDMLAATEDDEPDDFGELDDVPEDDNEDCDMSDLEPDTDAEPGTWPEPDDDETWQLIPLWPKVGAPEEVRVSRGPVRVVRFGG